MTHSQREISDAQLAQDIKASLHCARELIAELHREGYTPENRVLGHLLGAVTGLEEAVRRYIWQINPLQDR